jgi:uncharacterized RDD family membrane protein YckC
MNGTFFCSQCGAANTAGAQFCTRCGASTAPAGAVPAQGPPPASAAYPPPAAYSAGVRYGGFWIRFVAAIIDGIIIQVVAMPFRFMVGGGLIGMRTDFPHHGFPFFGGFLSFVIGLAIGWLYEAFLESSVRQATLGKMMLGLKVTDLAGNRISFERATGRYFAKWISGLTLLIGYIMAGFTARKQALHDMLAGTLVLYAP